MHVYNDKIFEIVGHSSPCYWLCLFYFSVPYFWSGGIFPSVNDISVGQKVGDLTLLNKNIIPYADGSIGIGAKFSGEILVSGEIYFNADKYCFIPDDDSLVHLPQFKEDGRMAFSVFQTEMR